MEENLDFEISFYEKLLKENPNFTDALVALGDAYTKKGLYEKGLDVDKRLIELKPDDPIFYYNLTCDYSLLKDVDNCLKALEKALQLGYRDFEFMEKDADLNFIREDERYIGLVAKYKEKSLHQNIP